MRHLKILETDIYIDSIPDCGAGGRRESERRAVAEIIRRVLPGCTLRHAQSGAPQIDGMHVSVSHSRHYAAVALSERPVGIDIEESRTAQLERVATRFLDDEEMAVGALSPVELLRAWTAKEAVFKALAPHNEGVVLSDIRLSKNMRHACFGVAHCFDVEHVSHGNCAPDAILAVAVRCG
ncbi:MAG: 4'-phosphopantetheinyl transferase superfamily protein [Bacteroidales bacterium]|nr:4'-phosphopantetheinyl transferase superfamily protein [Bacteroidales bacterium]